MYDSAYSGLLWTFTWRLSCYHRLPLLKTAVSFQLSEFHAWVKSVGLSCCSYTGPGTLILFYEISWLVWRMLPGWSSDNWYMWFLIKGWPCLCHNCGQLWGLYSDPWILWGEVPPLFLWFCRVCIWKLTVADFQLKTTQNKWKGFYTVILLYNSKSC